MSEPLVEQAPAKINLTLRVRGRRADGYHELESLVAFADLADTLTLQPGGTAALEVCGPFAAASGPVADNLVLKAVAALRKGIDGLTAGRFQLEKKLPVAAGIGGGSADAAAALRLLARVNGLALDDPRLSAAALATGADVPVCLAARPCIMRGLGERLSAPLALPSLPAACGWTSAAWLCSVLWPGTTSTDGWELARGSCLLVRWWAPRSACMMCTGD